MLPNKGGKSFEFPYELAIELKGNPDLEGRLTLISTHKGIVVDIDLIFSESKKIFTSFGSIGPFHEVDEARDQGVQSLSVHLKELQKASK